MCVHQVSKTCLSAEEARLQNIYFEEQQHGSLRALLLKLHTETDNALKLMVSTFSAISEHGIALADELKAADFVPDVHVIDHFSSSRALSKQLTSFFSDKEKNVLVLQSELRSAAALQRMGHARIMVCEEIAKQLTAPCRKHVVFCVHLLKDDNMAGALQPVPLVFTTGWHNVCISLCIPCSPSSDASLAAHRHSQSCRAVLCSLLYSNTDASAAAHRH